MEIIIIYRESHRMSDAQQKQSNGTFNYCKSVSRCISTRFDTLGTITDHVEVA